MARSPEPLPQLLDCAGLMKELGVRRSTAEAIMRELPLIRFDGHRKVFVRRDDVRGYIDENTTTLHLRRR